MSDSARWSTQSLAYQFQNTSLLDQALSHRSVGGTNNERLEFLGDAILGMLVAEALYHALPDADEGYLSRLRAHLVRRETLAEIAAEISLGGQIRLGPGELKSGGHRRASILANGLEAVLGAVYLDSGHSAAREVVLRLMRRRMDALPSHDKLKDPKTRLQETLQSAGQDLPVYSIDSVSGEDHRQRFTASCRLPDCGASTTGEGRSRRQAEQAAAEAMIAQLEKRDV
ncbi:MAG: ribonuclease III [Gammaproteobacteria bacterium]